MKVEVKVDNLDVARTKVFWQLDQKQVESFMEKREIPVLVLIATQFAPKIKKLGKNQGVETTCLTQVDHRVVLGSEPSCRVSFFDPGEGFLIFVLTGVSSLSEFRSLKSRVKAQAHFNGGLISQIISWGPCDDSDCPGGGDNWARRVLDIRFFRPECLGFVSVYIPPEACFVPWDDRFVRWAIGGRSKDLRHHLWRRLVAYPVGATKGLIVGLWLGLKRSFWLVLLVAILGLVGWSFYSNPTLAFTTLIIGLVTAVCSVGANYYSGRIIKFFDGWRASRKEARRKKWLDREFERLSTTKD